MPPPTPHRTQNCVPRKQNLIWYLHCCCPGQNSPLKGFQSKTRSTFSKRILPTEYYDVKEWSASPLVSSPERSLVFVTVKISKLAKGWARWGRRVPPDKRQRVPVLPSFGGNCWCARQAGWLAGCSPCWARRSPGKTVGGKVMESLNLWVITSW